jgi:NADPH:quinone reductase-like Zn-dependent oxidoreductase
MAVLTSVSDPVVSGLLGAGQWQPAIANAWSASRSGADRLADRVIVITGAGGGFGGAAAEIAAGRGAKVVGADLNEPRARRRRSRRTAG